VIDLSPLRGVSSAPKTISGGMSSSAVRPLVAERILDLGELLRGIGQVIVGMTGLNESLLSFPLTISGQAIVPAISVVPVHQTIEDEARRHIDEFYRRKREFLPQYSGKYVAFRDGRVVDSDVDKGVLARRFYKTYGYVPVCISKVDEKRRVVRAPTPRRRR